jgi:hypothetical protein
MIFTAKVYLKIVLEKTMLVVSGHDSMVVEFTITHAISAHSWQGVLDTTLFHGKVYSIQHYVIKFVSYLRQVSGFLRVVRFPPPIKLTATI